MPFKIVQTKENNKIVLTIVPSKWEQSGNLYWPLHRNELKLIHDENSVPKTDWKRMQCIKKREFSTYREAKQEQDIMEQASDTDAETMNMCGSKPKSRSLYSTRILQPIDLNDQLLLSQSAVADIQDSSSEHYVQQVENHIEPMVITIRSDETERESPSTSTHDINIANKNLRSVTMLDSKSSSNTSEPNSVASYVTVTQDQILAQLLENQEKIMSQLATLQASVDFLMNVNIKIKPTEQPIGRLPMQPLSSKNDFDELEAKLRDDSFYNKMVTEFTFICGNSGKCKGLDSCYKLVDYFFTRQIFLHCNWTGATRDSNAEKKIPFKFYSKIRNCFLDIIRKSDIDFSEHEVEKFFKVVIKNAKPRLQNKVNSVARTSKPRTKKQIIDGHNGEQLQENENKDNINDESPPPQQLSNEEAMNISLQNNENEAVNLNGEENDGDVVQNNVD